MNRRHFAAIALADLLAAGLAPTALATKMEIAVGGKTVPVELPDDEPFALWVQDETVTPFAQSAHVVPYINAADTGWSRLTRCDDLTVMCRTIPMRVETSVVPQGRLLFLDLPEAS